MYVILIYDVAEKRVSKMLKLCRQYLCWIQNSVFEGELSEVKLRELQNKIHSHPLKTIFQHKACTDKLYADSFYKVQKNSHSSFEVICCRR